MSTTSTTGTATAARLGDGIDAELRHLLPESLCRTFRVMPYAVVDGTVLVASADADDEIALEVVRERVKQPVLLVRHTAVEIIAAIDGTRRSRTRWRPRRPAGPARRWPRC